MEYFTQAEIEDIEAVYRSFCGDGRLLTDLELSIMRKLKAWVNALPIPVKKITLEEFKQQYPDPEC